MELLNRRVRFSVRDVYLPSRESVLETIFGDTVLEGIVMQIVENDQGVKFVVVKVEQLTVWVVVTGEQVTLVPEQTQM